MRSKRPRAQQRYRTRQRAVSHAAPRTEKLIAHSSSSTARGNVLNRTQPRAQKKLARQQRTHQRAHARYLFAAIHRPAVAARRERLGAMRPPCPRGCEAGRDGQGLLGWASGGPAGGIRVGAAPRVAAHLARNSNTARSHITHAQKKGRMQQRDNVPHVAPRTTTAAVAANAAACLRVSPCPRGRDAGRGGQGLFRRRASGAP